jgi:hypothetical protein
VNRCTASISRRRRLSPLAGWVLLLAVQFGMVLAAHARFDVEMWPFDSLAAISP